MRVPDANGSLGSESEFKWFLNKATEYLNASCQMYLTKWGNIEMASELMRDFCWCRRLR